MTQEDVGMETYSIFWKKNRASNFFMKYGKEYRDVNLFVTFQNLTELLKEDHIKKKN